MTEDRSADKFDAIEKIYQSIVGFSDEDSFWVLVHALNIFSVAKGYKIGWVVDRVAEMHRDHVLQVVTAIRENKAAEDAEANQ